MAERKPNIKFVDISDDMQNDAVDIATKAIEAHVREADIALQIKREFDKKHNPTWQCVVGREFGACVVQESKHFIHFYLGQLSILLWKTG
jgi:dynein light chain LC8-type